MPVRKLSNDRRRHSDHTKMVSVLAVELKKDEKELATPPYDLPLIVEDPIPRSDLLHVYVLWSQWQNVQDELQRSSIILDAYQQVRGEEEMRRISVAMGVTQQQAEAMGLDIGAS